MRIILLVLIPLIILIENNYANSDNDKIYKKETKKLIDSLEIDNFYKIYKFSNNRILKDYFNTLVSDTFFISQNISIDDFSIDTLIYGKQFQDLLDQVNNRKKIKWDKDYLTNYKTVSILRFIPSKRKPLIYKVSKKHPNTCFISRPVFIDDFRYAIISIEIAMYRGGYAKTCIYKKISDKWTLIFSTFNYITQ